MLKVGDDTLKNLLFVAARKISMMISNNQQPK